jgi:hypothetical protein
VTATCCNFLSVTATVSLSAVEVTVDAAPAVAPPPTQTQPADPAAPAAPDAGPLPTAAPGAAPASGPGDLPTPAPVPAPAEAVPLLRRRSLAGFNATFNATTFFPNVTTNITYSASVEVRFGRPAPAVSPGSFTHALATSLDAWLLGAPASILRQEKAGWMRAAAVRPDAHPLATELAAAASPALALPAQPLSSTPAPSPCLHHPAAPLPNPTCLQAAKNTCLPVSPLPLQAGAAAAPACTPQPGAPAVAWPPLDALRLLGWQLQAPIQGATLEVDGAATPIPPAQVTRAAGCCPGPASS